MKKIPFSLIPIKTLKKISRPFYGISRKLEHLFPFLKIYLKQANSDLSACTYLSCCFIADIIFLIFIFLVLFSVFVFFKLKNSFFVSITISLVLTCFVFFQQIMYPKIIANKRIKNIEKNLLSALQNILIQLNSGIPLFNILVNISGEDYGEVSNEFKKAVKEINAGKKQVEVLEEIASRNPSLYFRRALWQIVNGLKAGGDIAKTIREVINSLGEERVLQIKNYGAQLSPLAMFYMLLAVIIPALSITFITILCSLIGISESITKLVFFGLFGAIFFLQIMFLGIVKTRRPNLLG